MLGSGAGGGRTRREGGDEEKEAREHLRKPPRTLVQVLQQRSRCRVRAWLRKEEQWKTVGFIFGIRSGGF